ncbi:MAG: hypothetical protein M0D57_09895 [Sphingobacteriales bacterium JAD_PAG50586_3]|nr:MAG: hypothetical protein M0D57_09895 [Sphingobacteriales bacterium JAD_PAG50586_3]
MFDSKIVEIFAGYGITGLALLGAIILAIKFDWSLKGVSSAGKVFLSTLTLIIVGGIIFIAATLSSSYDKVYEGKIDDVGVVMELTISNGKISGREYYKEIRKDIIIVGTYNKENETILLWEQWPNGRKEGEYKGKLNENTISGTWTRLRDNKKRKFLLTETESDYEDLR